MLSVVVSHVIDLLFHLGHFDMYGTRLAAEENVIGLSCCLNHLADFFTCLFRQFQPLALQEVRIT